MNETEDPKIAERALQHADRSANDSSLLTNQTNQSTPHQAHTRKYKHIYTSSMAFVVLSKQAAKKIKAKQYHSKVDDLLSSNNVKIVGVAEVVVKTDVKVGVTGRRGVVNEAKEEIRSAVGRDKRTLVIIQDCRGEISFIFLYPNKTEKSIGDTLPSARVDAAFATDRGHSILTSSNTTVSRIDSSESGADTFVLRPEHTRYLKKEMYEVEIVPKLGGSSEKVAVLLDSLTH